MIRAVEVLVNILQFLTRHNLESVQLVNRKLSQLISSQANTLSVRKIYSVIIKDPTSNFQIRPTMQEAVQRFPPTELEGRLRHARTEMLLLVDNLGMSARAWRYLLNQLRSLAACWSNSTIYFNHIPTFDDDLCRRVGQLFRCKHSYADRVLDGSISNDSIVLPAFVLCSRFFFGQNQPMVGHYHNYIEWLHQPLPMDSDSRRIGPLNVSRNTRLEIVNSLIQVSIPSSKVEYYRL